jgi:hypothetical protein
MITHGLFRLVSTLLFGAWLVVGCAHRQGATPRELFAKIEIGMSRSEVDALLGSPFLPQLSPDDDTWYLPPPKIESHESPFAPGAIGVRFTIEGKVTSKYLNPQYRGR